jgi:hypothetical protein
MSSIVNKIKDAVHSDKTHSGTAAEGTHGPHSTRAANAADPRVDSDRDGSHRVGAGNSATAPPHSSNLANELDPRVNTGNTGKPGGYTHSDNYTHASGGVAGGLMDKTRMTGPAPNTAGPHTSDTANKLDPRIDSDRDGSTTLGRGNNNTGMHRGTEAFAENQGNTFGTLGTSGRGMFSSSGPGPAPNTAGHHKHDMANRMDPTVDSTRGPGPAPNTAGPHKSDMLNKADPRVDSDMDNSRTFGATGGNAYPRT